MRTRSQQSPFFESPILDRSIFVKHRLRANEYDAFAGHRTMATKILVPMDPLDLKRGAYSCFIGEKYFEELAMNSFGRTVCPGSRDWKSLEIIDNIPSLDPFLIKETLRRSDISPSSEYFNMSASDIDQMFEFARKEMGALVKLTGFSGEDSNEKVSKMTEILLSNKIDLRLEPLRIALQLDQKQYLDGLFSWRGFLYYKWVNASIKSSLHRTTFTNSFDDAIQHF